MQISSVRKRFQPEFEAGWENKELKLSIVGGKKLFNSLSDRMKKVLNVSFSDKQIASELSADEISQEIKDVFSAFEIK